jgi:hypothetical protein
LFFGACIFFGAFFFAKKNASVFSRVFLIKKSDKKQIKKKNLFFQKKFEHENSNNSICHSLFKPNFYFDLKSL